MRFGSVCSGIEAASVAFGPLGWHAAWLAEILMGFPQGYTAVPHRGKPAADGPRYKALGNSWAVPCVRWIGSRIQAAEERSSQPGTAT